MTDKLSGATTAAFVVALSQAVDEPVTVDWHTQDGSGKAGVDYEAASGDVTFLPGETTKVIEVTVYGRAEGDSAEGRVFYVRLNPPANAILSNTLTECVITVSDDNGVPVTSVVVAQGKRGLKGDPGLSAYEQAVLMGYQGTIEDWMQEIADASASADRAAEMVNAAEVAATKAEAAAASAAFSGRIFQTPEQGVDPVTGVPVGNYFNVRSADADSYLDEYQNVDGAPVATGKSYPSAQGVENARARTFEPDSEQDMLALDAKRGELAIRKDVNKTFILKEIPASEIGNWKEIENDALAKLAKLSGAESIGTASGNTVQQEIDAANGSLTDISEITLPEIQRNFRSAISTTVKKMNAIKVPDRTYDGFGNSVFWNGRNLFCFRRSVEHLDQVDSVHSVCIAEIFKDGSYELIWEYSTPLGQAAKEPHISVTNPGNMLVIAFSIHDVAADTYFKAIIGYPNLDVSGAFSSKSDITTTTGYYLWGNILTTPDGKLMTARYNVSGKEVQIITSSDSNLNGATTWSVTKSLGIEMFSGRTLINETCLGYYRNQLVAVIRNNDASGAAGICIAKTNDMSGANGWVVISTGYKFAAPRIEAYVPHDDPLVIVGTTTRSVTPMYRSDVSMTMTYDLSAFSTQQVLYRGDYFNCYASAKKVADGIYDLISFDENVDNNAYVEIHHQYFYLEQNIRPKTPHNYKHNWLQSLIGGIPCYGDLALANDTVVTSNLYFSVVEPISGIKRIMLLVGPVASAVTITPTLKRVDGTTYASFFNVNVPASTLPQVIMLNPPAGTLAFNTFERLNLSLSSPLPVGCVSGISGTRLPITCRLPFNMYNAVGETTSPYMLMALGKM